MKIKSSFEAIKREAIVICVHMHVRVCVCDIAWVIAFETIQIETMCELQLI